MYYINSTYNLYYVLYYIVLRYILHDKNGEANDAILLSKSTFNETLQQKLSNIPAKGIFLSMMPFHYEQVY
jgi:hypothetical protein